MSYVVSIVREAPIEEAELREIAGDSSEFELEASDGHPILHWRMAETDKRESFVLTDGALDITTPSDAALIAAQDLAERLGARVEGEEGEDLTDVDVTGNVTVASGCGPMTATLAIVALLLVVYWLFA